jgi:hypothetical protein
MRDLAESGTIEAIINSQGTISFSDLFLQLQTEGRTDIPAIRGAIWKLIAQEKIELTEERDLSVRSANRKASRKSELHGATVESY